MSGPSALITESIGDSHSNNAKRSASSSPPNEALAKKATVSMSQVEMPGTPVKVLLRSPKLNPKNMAPPPPTGLQAPTSSVNTNSKLSYNVSTDNKFASNSDTALKAPGSIANKQRQPKMNIPPFVFTSAGDIKLGKDIVYKHAQANHYIKYMRVGSKIQVDSMVAYLAYLAIDKEMEVVFGICSTYLSGP